MFFAKNLVTLIVAATIAVASPVKRQSTTNCLVTLTPTPEFPAGSVQTDLNFAIGHTVAVEFTGSTVDNFEPIVSYNVQVELSVSGESEETVAAFIETWPGTTISGIAAQWAVSAAECS
ncbi:hypothetical protein BDP27DRAFT_1446312 [Rhodocollybia butyracea]|uniref:Uncharacterized protein n=1 Tax=Rhodocollybia butyracea TaxID=206335 RepID=A0A9P5PSP9_9AGAR|nr:hypothetical protein BDP27DRAFT_1446312 [Rhodocollybia butyracea]